MLEELQRSLARSKPSNPTPITEGFAEAVPSMRSTRIPQSLLINFPTSLPRGDQTQRAARPKKALSLFDQTFGDDLDMDDIFGTPSLGPISAMETKALPGPPGALRLDFSKQPLPRPAFQQWTEEPKVPASMWNVLQQITSSSSDSFQQVVEPRSIEEMMHVYSVDDFNPLQSNTFFVNDGYAEQSLQVMET